MRTLEDDDAEADEFALELLMPSKFLRQDLVGIEIDIEGKWLHRLAKRYRVTQGLMAYRLAASHLLSRRGPR